MRFTGEQNERLIDGKPASYDDPVIMVGSKESYEPRCRHHHIVLNAPERKVPGAPRMNEQTV